MSPTISGIYGHTEQTFEALNATGMLYLEALKQAGYVDYTLNTWTTIPALDAKYEWSAGRTNLYFLSTYKYFYTDDFHNSSSAIQVALFGNIRSGLDTSHLYTVNARLVVDMMSSFKFLQWVGLGASYYWSGNVTGWSVGLDARLLF